MFTKALVKRKKIMKMGMKFLKKKNKMKNEMIVNVFKA